MHATIESLMQGAIAEARRQGTPYGALILHRPSGEVLRVANQVRQTQDPTAHAEVVAIREMAQRQWPGSECTLVSTCEPCPMCAMAAVWAGISAIYFGAAIDDAARFGHQVKIYASQITGRAWYDICLEGGILREACVELFAVREK